MADNKLRLIYGKERISLVDVVRFHASLVRELPDALSSGWDKIATWTAIGLFILGFINPEIVKWLITTWDGISRWWSLLPLALLVIYGLLKANRQRFVALERAHARLLEETDHKLILEVVEGPWRHWNGQDQYSRVSVVRFSEDGQGFSTIMADIRLRFSNHDVHKTRIESLSLVIRRESPGELAQEAPLISHLETMQGTQPPVDQIFIDARDKSCDYELRTDVDGILDADWHDRFDSHSFLRIKMEAVGQRTYCVDLNADWAQSLKNEAPWEWGRLTIRKTSSC